MTSNAGRLSAEILGGGTRSAQLQKLTIQYEDGRAGIYSGKIEALFNPNELRYSRSVTWREQRKADIGSGSDYTLQVFSGIEPERLTVELFYDTYEPHQDGLTSSHVRSALLPANPLAGPTAASVKPHIDALAKLAQNDRELHCPPHCLLMWGTFEVFRGVLTSLSYSYTMFMPDGTPVRARATCDFLESESRELARRRNELHSADVDKVRVVRLGESLHTIAAQEYEDPARWRELARANGIINPRAVMPGTRLVIPKLL